MEENSLPNLFPTPCTESELLKGKNYYMTEPRQFMRDANLMLGNNMTKKQWYFAVFIRYLFTFPAFTAFAIHLIRALMEKNLQHITDDVSDVCFCLTSYFISFMMIQDQDILSEALGKTSNIAEFGIPPKYFFACKIHNLLTRFTKFFILLTMATYTTLKFFQIPDCREYNKINNKNEFCELPLPAWIPFNHDYWPLKIFLFVYELSAIRVIVAPPIIAVLVEVLYIHHVIMQMNHITLMLRELKTIDYKKGSLLKQGFIRIAKYHQHLKKYVDDFNTVSKPGNLLVMIFAGLSIALNCLNVMIYHNLGAAFVLVLWASSLAFPSIVAQFMMNAEEEIYDELLTLNWYEYNKECKFCIQMLIGTLQHPICIFVGPFTILGFEYLLARLKETFSYLTLMNQFLTYEE